jgi:hypothetical protein
VQLYKSKAAQFLKNRLAMLLCPLDKSIPRINGNCFVLGSAPTTPLLPEGFNEKWSMITVNASSVIARRLGIIKPDYTVMSGRMLYDKQANREAQSAIQDGCTKRLILIERGDVCSEKAGQLLNEINFAFDEYYPISHRQRAKITHTVTGKNLAFHGGNRKISTGLFAVVLALHLSAKNVILSGFSLTQDGHYYSSSNLVRAHRDMDRYLLNLLTDKGFPIYAADKNAQAEMNVPLWKDAT